MKPETALILGMLIGGLAMFAGMTVYMDTVIVPNIMDASK